ncbi:hypothetical protein ACGFYM_36140 [Streptomyces sp. NPDC048231]|uniref:hypothetical protein n=1 Tax=Streptomyces sp. NPDC048231 TaxID=3365519 RepID=UPI0037238E1F
MPDTHLNPARTATSAPVSVTKADDRASERLLVRETLTYLAATLPRFSSPAARLLALQCSLRADVRGRVRFPDGLLRGMRLHGRTELWSELEYAGWLQSHVRRRTNQEACLLDPAMHAQATGRMRRTRAAHWALDSAPLAPPRNVPPALRLTALALAAHTADGAGQTEFDILTRLCGQSPQQMEAALDHLVRLRLLRAWQRQAGHDELSWQLSR